MDEVHHQEKLVNRVANSPLKTINLEQFYPESEFIELDIADFLFKGLLLREKEFRKSLKEKDWSDFKDKIVCIYCSTDAILPTWSFMLITTHLSGIATECYQGTKKEYIKNYYDNKIQEVDWSSYEDKMVVIKGCGELEVPASAYLKITQKLVPLVKSLMFGEPCSTVPIFKKPRKK